VTPGRRPQLSRLLPYLRRHRTALARGLGCLVATTAFSVAGPWVLRFAIDDLASELTRSKLALYGAALVGIAVVEGIFRYGMRMILIGVSREIEFELRDDLFAHLTRLAPADYHELRIGDVMSRATSDLSAVRMVLGPGIMYTANTVATFVGAATLMARISPRLLLLSLVPLVLVSILVRYFGRRIHDRFEAVQEQLAELTTIAQENLTGARVVRAYAQEQAEQARFEAANQEHLRRNRRLILLFASLYPGIQLLMGTGAVLVVWLGGRMVIDGTISLGEFVAFGAYLTMLNWPMIALGWVINLFERGEASMGRLCALLDRVPKIRDERTTAVGPLRGAVELRGLSFGYDGGPAVLHDIDLRVEAGQTIAIVGPTASGKSTLVSLIARIHDPPPGTLFLDGHDVLSLPLSELRGAIGFVPQETFLFSDTLGGNIAFGLPSETPRLDERRRWGARVSQLERDLEQFPKGFETLVGERGITLSGGQKQRTAIARAIVLDPPILILDDALSSVDTETEERILSGLREVMRTRTTFLVSHRVSTVKDADLIVVLQQGRIAERGTHDDLLRLGGLYAQLHRRQALEAELLVG
jgi:ATP-binding cassette subfamily B multidrug efflux pump